MVRETLSDPEVVERLNTAWLCVAIDGEQRPDLTTFFQSASQILGAESGWPLTIFLTPDAEPFFAGTFFPKDGFEGHERFADVLGRAENAWAHQRAHVQEQGARVVHHLQTSSGARPGSLSGGQAIDQSVHAFGTMLQESHAGLAQGAIAPQSAALRWLISLAETSDSAVVLLSQALDAVAGGALRDHIGGGFFWSDSGTPQRPPEPAKTLRDNARLAQIYLAGHVVSGEGRFRDVGLETLDFLIRELRGPRGQFYAGLRASETQVDEAGSGERSAHETLGFTWRAQDVHQALDGESAAFIDAFCSHYGLEDPSPEAQRQFLRVVRPLGPIAARLGLDLEALDNKVRQIRARLQQWRAHAAKHQINTQVLPSGNGLVMSTLAYAYLLTGTSDYLEAAQASGEFLLETLPGDGDGVPARHELATPATVPLQLEDLVYFGFGCLELFQVTGEVRWLDGALRLARGIENRLYEPELGTFVYSRDTEVDLPAPVDAWLGEHWAPGYDAARFLCRLGALTGHQELLTRSQNVVSGWLGWLEQNIAAAPTGLLAHLDTSVRPMEVVALTGAEAERFAPFRKTLAKVMLGPNALVVTQKVNKAAAEHVPSLRGEPETQAGPRVYLSREEGDWISSSDPVELAGMIRAYQDAAIEGYIQQSATLQGRAGPEATKRWAQQFLERWPNGYARLGRTGLTVSRLAFGGYRIAEHKQAHRQALQAALSDGCNLVDTAANFGGGGSERLVGSVLAELAAQQKYERDCVVVVSKAGYIDAAWLDAMGEDAPAEIEEIADNSWHSIHPAFLERALARSRENLRLECIDVFLLQNPEEHLQALLARSDDASAAEQLFYERIQLAFSLLEEWVAQGRIGWYGLACNTLGEAAPSSGLLSLPKLWDIASDVGGEGHHFAVLQIPLNVLEPGVLRNRSGMVPNGSSALTWARRRNVGILANRPLNASLGGRVVRLVDIPAAPKEPTLSRHLDALAELEQTLRDRDVIEVETMDGSIGVKDIFTKAEELGGVAIQIRDLAHWTQLQGTLKSQLDDFVQLVDAAFAQSDANDLWQKEYRKPYIQLINEILRDIGLRALEESRLAAQNVRGSVRSAMGRYADTPLAQQMVWTVMNTPGVSAVLCGMRQKAYADQLMQTLAWPNHPNVPAVYEAATDLPWTRGI